MKLIFPLLFSLLLIIFNGCKKEETVTVADNTAPPDSTISNTTIENYINRVYISVLGREPSGTEYDFAYNLLRTNNLSIPVRNQFLDDVFADTDYRINVIDKAFIELLNSLDTTEITTQIFLFNLLLNDPQYQLFYAEIQKEIDRLTALQVASSDYTSGAINVIEVHRRMVNNYFYDQINMGSLNFVVSVFQHFLDRYPTNFELEEGIKMVDGNSATLFLQTGQSKTDFISIFFTSDDYYEGQVRGFYNRYLFRNPNSYEMTNNTQQYQASNNYEQLQKNILATNEYIGI